MNRKQLKMIRERIKAEWGDSCTDHDTDCPVCQAWEYYYKCRAKVDATPLVRD